MSKVCVRSYPDLEEFSKKLEATFKKEDIELDETNTAFEIKVSEEVYKKIALQLWNRNLTYVKPEVLQNSGEMKLTLNNIRFKLVLR